LINAYPDSPELPGALYLLAMTAEALGQPDAAALTYRDVRLLTPASGYAEGASDRIVALQAAGVRLPPLTPTQRIERAERLLRSNVPDVAMSEAQGIAAEVKESAVVTRALRVVADSARNLRQYDVAARTLGLVADRSSAERRAALKLEQARLYVRAKDPARALGRLPAAGALLGRSRARAGGGRGRGGPVRPDPGRGASELLRNARRRPARARSGRRVGADRAAARAPRGPHRSFGARAGGAAAADQPRRGGRRGAGGRRPERGERPGAPLRNGGRVRRGGALSHGAAHHATAPPRLGGDRRPDFAADVLGDVLSVRLAR